MLQITIQEFPHCLNASNNDTRVSTLLLIIVRDDKYNKKMSLINVTAASCTCHCM